MNFGPAEVSEFQRERLRLLLSVVDDMSLGEIWSFLDSSDSAAPDDVRAFMRARWMANDPGHIKAAAEHLLTEPDLSEELAAIAVPKAVVSGSPDLTWDPADVRAMANALSAHLITVPDGGHSPNVHFPDETATALITFWSADHVTSSSGY
jgi:pimeloyl-ACP methyl ester carboxylesterase